MAQESRLVIVIDAKNAERNARNLGNELDSIERKGDFATKSMDALSVATRQLAGYMAGLVTVSAAISKMDTYTGLQNRLKLVTNNQVELNKATEDTFRIAQKTYSAWDSVLQVYQRFSDNAKTLNLTMDDTARLTETVSKAVAISGASAEAADAALVQFGQALASGTLRGEELNSVMEQTPALAKAIAQGMGITVGELRSVAAEGKITSQEIVKALRNVQDEVDALFAKTDITIGQSLTLLNNEITKFVGEAGKGSGAAQALSGSIQLLANNLNLIADSAFAIGIGLMTKAVLTKTVAVQASIAASAQQRAASLAEAQAQAQLLGVEALRAKQSAALAITELGLARAEYNAATTAKERAAAVQRKTAAEVAHSIALKESTAATLAYKAAQDVLNKSASIGSRALDLVGGPIGAITLGITALAAGYMYFQDKAAQANKKLEEQAAVAKKAKEELLALKGLEKDSAINDMTASFERQNQALADSSSKINIQLNAIAQLYKGNKEIVQVVNDARDGTISMNDAVKRFNELRISKDIYNALKENSSEFEKNAKEAKTTQESLKLFGIEVELSGRKAQTAVAGIDDNSKALIGNESAAQKATKAQKGYFDSLRSEVLNSNEELALLNLGYSEETVKKILELQKAKQAVAPPGTTAIVTKEEMDQIAKAQKALDALKEKKDELTAAERKHTSELEKQQKVLSINAKVQANAAKYNFSGIESKYNLPAGTLSAIHMIESRGNARAYNKSTGATGGFQFLEGTAKQYGVKDRYDLAQSAEGAGKYMSYLLKLFKGDLEKAVRAYHAGEGNVQKGKGIGKNNNQYWKDYQGYMAGINGYTAGDITSKGFDKLLQDATKMAEDQAKLRLQLENDVADEVTKIRNDLAKKLEDVDKANFTPERKAEIKAELQARADNDIAIAQQALRTKLDDYKQFNLTEEQLLKESFDRKKFSAAHDIELSKDQRDEAIKYLDQQYQHELELINLTKAARQSAYDQANLKALQELKQERDILAAPIWQRAGLSLQFGERNALSENDATLINKGDEAKMKLKQKEIDQLEYNKRIEDAVRIHEENKFKIQEEYNEKYRDLQKNQYTSQLQIWSSLLSQGQGVWSNLTQSVKDASGEQSKRYKTMFAMQQAFAIASTIVSAHLAAAQTTADITLPFVGKVPAATAILGFGYAQAGLIAAQTIAGFSSGGYTGNMGRTDVAGVVHGQEYVLNAAATKRVGVDTLNAINSGQSLEKASSNQPIVNIYNLPGQTADVTRNDDGSLDVRIRQIAGEVAEKVMLDGIYNQNSRIGKALKQNYNVAPKR
ncbi:TPA: tape measure protein [Acinetobacter baumannii]|nr:tape measure protein [Acinetobacter baumannii]